MILNQIAKNHPLSIYQFVKSKYICTFANFLYGYIVQLSIIKSLRCGDFLGEAVGTEPSLNFTPR